ncbi:uncharacterized protein [Euwallacea fornicatus]|uniref:uncharacterized protein n=1 Tax=Euwallacea fornicatus TaxID=995702 RepID=UPI0033903824
MAPIKVCFMSMIILQFVFMCSGKESKNSDWILASNASSEKFIGRMMEEGRTLVHHTMKRFMIILPAIFFKLGVAFTLLILVTIATVNNGFIGFLLLIVGLSNVLARLQEARRPPASLPYIAPSPYFHHVNVLERSDATGKTVVDPSAAQYPEHQYYLGGKPYSAQLSQSSYPSRIA